MLSQVVRHRHRSPPCNTDALPLHSVAWPVGGLRHTGTQKDQKTGCAYVFGSQADKMPQDFIHNREKPRGEEFDVASMQSASHYPSVPRVRPELQQASGQVTK